MKFLAIDLSLDNFNIIIGEEKDVIFSKTVKLLKDRNKALFESLNYVQKMNIIDFQELQTVYATIGPGNFNGIRISISAIKAIALVNESVDIAGISSLDALVRSHPNDNKKNICAAIKSSPGYIYIQWFDKYYRPKTEVKVINIEKENKLFANRNNFIIVGNASEILKEKFNYKDIKNGNNIITTNGLFDSINFMILNKIYIKASPLYLRDTNIIKPSLWKRTPTV